MKSTTPSILFGAVTLALLSACGGDGDGGGSDAPGTSAPAAVAITTTNQTPVARATIASGFAVAQTQTSGSSGASAAGASRNAHSLAAAVRHALGAVGARRSAVASAGAHPAATTSDTEQCGVSGNFTSSFDDKDGNNQLSAGDVVNVVFSQCRDSSEELVDGTLVITVTSVTSQEQFVASAVLQNFKVVEADLSSTINGNVTITENDNGVEDDTTLVVGSGGLAVATSSTSYNDTITFENGMRIVTHESDTSSSDSITLDGGFSATSISGSVTVATLQPIVQTEGNPYPTSGQVRVTGAGNSALQLTALNATQVELKLDANGDGTYEGTTDVDWSTLIP